MKNLKRTIIILMEGKKPLKYPLNEKGNFVCRICGETFTSRSNASKHYKNMHEKKGNISDFTYRGKQILKATENILIWKATHGIPMRALNDSLLADLLPPDTIKSDKTNQLILNEICKQIVEQNYQKARQKSISLIMDGGTVNHTKWLAIGYLFRTTDNVNFQVLDILVFEKTTSAKIKDEIERISSIIKDNYNGKIVGCCTDNVANFKKVFLEPEEHSIDIVPLDIIRVSCACHTIQLALKDLKKEDSYYKNLINIMKIIPTRISFLSRQEIQSLGISSFPPLQKQRWNSVYKTLNYIINNIDSLECLFNTEEIIYLRIFDMTNLIKELEPINHFTLRCESDSFTQAEVFIEYRALETKMEIIQTPRAEKLLELIHNRFNTTADIEISRLCFYCTNQGIREKQSHYPHIPLVSLDPDDNDSNEKYDKELDFILSFKGTIKKLCKKLKLDSAIVFEAFKLMMYHYFPPNDDIKAYPGPMELRTNLKEHVNDLVYYISLSKLIEVLMILPASEAGAERIFARMRDLYNKKQTRLSPESLRSNLIVSFYKQKCIFDDEIIEYDLNFGNDDEDLENDVSNDQY